MARQRVFDIPAPDPSFVVRKLNVKFVENFDLREVSLGVWRVMLFDTRGIEVYNRFFLALEDAQADLALWVSRVEDAP
jgi:hypothetical protein